MLNNGTGVLHIGFNFTLLSISSLLMSDGELPVQNIQPNSKGAGWVITGICNTTASAHECPRHHLMTVGKGRDLLQQKLFKKTYSIP